MSMVSQLLGFMNSVPPLLAVSAVSLGGSVVVLGYTVRWSFRSKRHLRRERERRRKLEEHEAQRVSTLEREAASSWAGYRKFQVVKRIEEDREGHMVSFELAPFEAAATDSGSLPGFNPGQYLQIRVDIPGQATLLSRCYSLSQAYTPNRYRFTVGRVPSRIDPVTSKVYPPGVVSGYLLDRVHERAVLDVTIPQGDFWLNPQRSEPVVLVGWGIHSTPLLCMFETIARLDTNREVWLFIELGSEEESPQATLKPLLMLARRASKKSGRLHVWISYGGWDSESGMGATQRIEESQEIVPRPESDPESRKKPVVEREGRQAAAWVKRALPPHYRTSAEFYVSGPALMLREAKHDLGAWGVPDEHVHFEVFDRESLDAISELEEDTGSSQVTFEASKKTVAWDPEARNLLGLAAENKVRIPNTCKIGKCGECEVTLVSGKVRYAKDPDWKLKPGTCLACVATPASATVVLGA
jgi:ferredoxin-NADP reductase